MNEFLYLFRNDHGATRPSAEAMEAQMKRWQSWMGKLSEEGKLKDWGAPLHNEGKIVATGGVVTDGPYTDGKEIIGGYLIVKAKDLSEAAAISKGCPIFEAGGTVEVRPIAPM